MRGGPLQAGLVQHKDAGAAEADLLGAAEGDGDEEFAIVFAAMGVNMETAHFFKQVRRPPPLPNSPNLQAPVETQSPEPWPSPCVAIFAPRKPEPAGAGGSRKP